MAECVSCGKPLSDISRFCPHCGTTVEKAPEPAAAPASATWGEPETCRSCGAPLIAGDAFCGDCGTPMTSTAAAVRRPTQPPISSQAPAVAVPASQAAWSGSYAAPAGGAPSSRPSGPAFGDVLSFRAMLMELNPVVVFWVAMGVDALFWLVQFIYYRHGGALAFLWCLVGFALGVVVIRILVEIAVMLSRTLRALKKSGGGQGVR